MRVNVLVHRPSVRHGRWNSLRLSELTRTLPGTWRIDRPMDATDTGAVASLLHIISAAVTPVVMISACASLLLTINNKHSNISDRMRNLAVELRSGNCTPARRKQVLSEIGVFRRRFSLTYVAHMALNIGIV